MRSSCCLALDDEKYFTHDGSNMQGSDNTNDISKCPDSIRFAGKEKCPEKVMVWLAISNCGISSTETVESDININECLEK